jgi:GNAT superfamily N-acetyltransferase
LKDSIGTVRGGVTASIVYNVMYLEVLWVDENLRRHGYGSQLVLDAERIGLEKGCLTAQTWNFSFQGHEFYPTVGYELIGIYDGYPNGITEHVYMKRLSPNQHKKIAFGVPYSQGFYITTDVSEEDEKILHQGLHHHVIAHIGDGYKGVGIKLVAKDKAGELIGGLSAWTTLQNLIFEHIWIEERFRGQDLGRKLMLEMERIARENGCIASQASCFSFPALGIIEKMGYQILGLSNGYPDPVKEYYLIKKYDGLY